MGRLVCTNFNETRTYKVIVGEGEDKQEAIFELGVIPRDIKMKCQRLIDKDNQESYLEAIWLSAKYGICSHEGLDYVDKEGHEKALPFITEQDEKGRSIIHDNLLESYLDAGFLAEVSAEALLKGMGKQVKDGASPSIENLPKEVGTADTKEQAEQTSSQSLQVTSSEKTV